MFTQPWYDLFVTLAKWGHIVEFIYFGDHAQVPPLATPVVVVGA